MPKILLLEDNEEQSAFMMELLESERYLVDLVADGERADLQLRCAEYDLLILDWQTPRMSGIDVCRRYRARGGGAPVLMLTAKMSELDKETGFDAGADDYLVKPFSLKELLACLKAHLRCTTVRRLRQKLGEESEASIIENVHGVGYRTRSSSKQVSP
ncbi:MAG TPA: response regulator [Oculatellaceae cyanobacterium]